MTVYQQDKTYYLQPVRLREIFFVAEIIEEFLRKVSSKKGEVSANLFSSKKLDEKTISEIEKEISENVNGTIKLKSKVDETLIGGIVLQIGSLMIDTSIKNKLANYKKVLMEN